MDSFPLTENNSVPNANAHSIIKNKNKLKCFTIQAGYPDTCLWPRNWKAVETGPSGVQGPLYLHSEPGLAWATNTISKGKAEKGLL